MPSKSVQQEQFEVPLKGFVAKAIAGSTWDLGNQVLYDLCSRFPDHARADAVAAKIWLIGRSYAASIERRPIPGSVSGDAFYEERVIPKIMRSDIDRWFGRVAASNRDDVDLLLEVHAKVTRLFKDITQVAKRSLASKYLHFHFPNHYFLYDARSQYAIRCLTKVPRNRSPTSGRFDGSYAKFFYSVTSYGSS